jgi:hypothetical integral membrane protein (TIGR02206 family)
MTPAPFVLFGPAHLSAIALTLLVPLALAAITRTRAKVERGVRLAFAAWLIGTWVLWLWMIFGRGWASAQTLLPMHLCDWATLAAIVTLIRPNQRSYELTYFWALAATFQAMLTPDLAFDFPDLRFVVFFAFHGGVIAAVLYLTFGMGMRPIPASLPRVIAWSFAYLGAAGAVDWLLKVNFGYLRAKPVQASLLDALAPWPWYIGELAVLGVASVLIWYAPWFVADRIRARRPDRRAQTSRERP